MNECTRNFQDRAEDQCDGGGAAEVTVRYIDFDDSTAETVVEVPCP
jgi:hypothetical protein